MATAPMKLWAIADLADLPEDGRYEVWEGELIEMAAAGHEHSSIVLRIGGRMQAFVEEHQLGEVSGPDGGYVLARDPMTLYMPDVAFVRSGRMQTPLAGFPQLVPDLVVEVISPNDRSSEVAEKIRVYIEVGVAVIWVVYPRQQMVAIHRGDQPNDVRQAQMGDTLEEQRFLPGFRLPVATIFRAESQRGVAG